MSDPKPVYKVLVPKKLLKQLRFLPPEILDRFDQLQLSLMDSGPMQPAWPNFSKLGPHKYHCHLAYSWVACWKFDKGNILIEVYYVGHRKNAPY